MKLRINSHEFNIAEISDSREDAALPAAVGTGASPVQAAARQPPAATATRIHDSEANLRRAHAPSRFGEYFLRNFPQRNAEFKHRRYRTAPPPGYFPMRPDKLDLRPGRQIE
jgi:hypothetical protein